MSNLKKTLQRVLSFSVWIILFYLVLNSFIKGSTNEGRNYSSTERINLNNEGTITFPQVGKNSIILYWATWCAPCRLEMLRLKKIVDNNPLLGNYIFAISLSESDETIKNFLLNHDYPFQFIAASTEDQKLQIEATPTTVFLRGNKVESFSQGMSIIGIWKAESFLKENH